MQKQKKKKKSYFFSILFLILVLFIYLIIFLFHSDSFFKAIEFTYSILLTIVPVLFLVFLIMALFNYYLKPKTVSKYLGGNAGWKGWSLSTLFGIFSHGSIYIWYPLLKQLHQKGMSYGFIAVFLYNRAVKIPLLPALILYFGLTYTIVLLFVMIIAGLIEGKIVDIMMKKSQSVIQ